MTVNAAVKEATKVTITATAKADSSVSAKCEVTVSAYDFTKSSGGDGEKEEDVKKATAKTYSFTGGVNGIVLTDVSDWTIDKKLIISPAASSLTEKKLSNGATLHWKGASLGTLRFRTSSGEKVDADTVAAITAINYNGGQKNDDFKNGATIANLDRYITIPVDGAGSVSASIKFVSSAKTGTLQAGFFDDEGTLLGTLATADVATGGEKTLTCTVTEETTVYLAFSRNGAGGGGLDVTSIEVKP